MTSGSSRGAATGPATHHERDETRGRGAEGRAHEGTPRVSGGTGPHLGPAGRQPMAGPSRAGGVDPPPAATVAAQWRRTEARRARRPSPRAPAARGSRAPAPRRGGPWRLVAGEVGLDHHRAHRRGGHGGRRRRRDGRGGLRVLRGLERVDHEVLAVGRLAEHPRAGILLLAPTGVDVEAERSAENGVNARVPRPRNPVGLSLDREGDGALGRHGDRLELEGREDLLVGRVDEEEGPAPPLDVVRPASRSRVTNSSGSVMEPVNGSSDTRVPR